MAAPINAWRVTKYAAKDLLRNAWLGAATAFVLMLSLLSVNVVIGVQALVERAIGILENKVDISVYFRTDTPNAVVQQAQFFMASLPQVKDVTMLEAEQSLARFREVHANDPSILEALDELRSNPLGAALIIKAKQPEDYTFLLQALQNPQFGTFIESKSYDDHADAITSVQQIGKSARVFGAVLVAIFALFSVMIVYNAIRVAIYTQREEIGIMRLVGASGAFVRMPFVIEGIMVAGISLVVSSGVTVAAAAFFDERLRPLFDGADPGLFSYIASHAGQLLLVEGSALAALVAISSWAAVGKYLKR